MDIIVNESLAREWFLEQLRLFPQLPVMRLSQKWYASAMNDGILEADEWMESVYSWMVAYQGALQRLAGVRGSTSSVLEPILLDVLKQAGKLEII